MMVLSSRAAMSQMLQYLGILTESPCHHTFKVQFLWDICHMCLLTKVDLSGKRGWKLMVCVPPFTAQCAHLCAFSIFNVVCIQHFQHCVHSAFSTLCAFSIFNVVCIQHFQHCVHSAFSTLCAFSIFNIVCIQHFQHCVHSAFSTLCAFSIFYVVCFQYFLRVLRAVSDHCARHRHQPGHLHECHLGGDLHSAGLWPLLCHHGLHDHLHDPVRLVWPHVPLGHQPQCCVSGQPHHGECSLLELRSAATLSVCEVS